MPSPNLNFDAVVIGAGIAGAAIVKSLKNNNINAMCSLFDGILSLNVLLAAEKSHIKKRSIKMGNK